MQSGQIDARYALTHRLNACRWLSDYLPQQKLTAVMISFHFTLLARKRTASTDGNPRIKRRIQQDDSYWHDPTGTTFTGVDRRRSEPNLHLPSTSGLNRGPANAGFRHAGFQKDDEENGYFADSGAIEAIQHFEDEEAAINHQLYLLERQNSQHERDARTGNVIVIGPAKADATNEQGDATQNPSGI